VYFILCFFWGCCRGSITSDTVVFCPLFDLSNVETGLGPWMQTSLKILVHNLSQMTEEEEKENEQKQPRGSSSDPLPFLFPPLSFVNIFSSSAIFRPSTPNRRFMAAWQTFPPPRQLSHLCARRSAIPTTPGIFYH